MSSGVLSFVCACGLNSGKVVAVVLGSVFAYSFLNKGQEDTKLDLISLNEIDNTASFLWVDKKQGETTFYVSGIEMERSSSNDNPYFEKMLTGRVIHTIYRGELVVTDSEVVI